VVEAGTRFIQVNWYGAPAWHGWDVHGAIIGTSDNHGAYPATRPVNIPELAAAVYRLMGINTNTNLRIRPFLGDAVPMDPDFRSAVQ